MPGSGELLALAHAHVSQAAALLTQADGYDAASARLRCDEVIALLQDCGAVADADLLCAEPAGDPRTLLLAADQALDEIPAAARPLLLGSARAELTGAILSVTAPN